MTQEEAEYKQQEEREEEQEHLASMSAEAEAMAEMEERIPTKEQIKEFWERYGFKYLPRGSHDKFKRFDAIQYPDGTFHSSCPDIDLNNLFKYAVPKAIEELAQRILPDTDEVTRKLEALKIILTNWLEKIKQGLTYEDALFWALWQVKEK